MLAHVLQQVWLQQRSVDIMLYIRRCQQPGRNAVTAASCRALLALLQHAAPAVCMHVPQQRLQARCAPLTVSSGSAAYQLTQATAGQAAVRSADIYASPTAKVVGKQ
jgi:hypothetical protein